MPANQAPLLDNFLIYPGRIVMRGPVIFEAAFNTSTIAAAGFNCCGALGGDPAWLLLTAKAQSATAHIDHWNVPLLKPNVSTQLGTVAAQGGWSAPSGSSTPAQAVGTAPGPRYINFDGLLYYISYDAATTAADVNSNYVCWKTQLCTRPLTATSPPAATVLASAPVGAFDLKGHLGRVWLLGGVDVPGAGTTHSSTTLFFTNPIASGGGGAGADWQDPVTGLTNQIVMDKNTSDFGVGLAVTRGGLVIFRRSSIWFLRGSTSANFTLVPVSREDGCLDARSIVEADNGVYFLGWKGLMLTDGIRVRNVSGSCMRTLQATIMRVQHLLLSSTTDAYMTCALTSHGQIAVSIGAVLLASGTIEPFFSGLYDPAINAWTCVTSQLTTTITFFTKRADSTVGNNPRNYPGLLISKPASRELYSIGDIALLRWESGYYAHSFAEPTSQFAYAGGLGVVSTGLFDGGGVVPFTSTLPAIPARWKTRFIPVVGSSTLMRKFGQLKRYFLDYTFNANDAYDTLTGWSITPIDSSQAQLPGSATVTTGSIFNQESTANSPVPNVVLWPVPRITRLNQDLATEIEDMAFDITFTQANAASGNGAVKVVAELHGVGVEYQPTRDIR